MNKIISIIAAIGDNRELGKENKLLWHIKEDFLHFKTLTRNHPVIMGRKTFASIGKPLPDRTNIIVTSDMNFHAEGCAIMHSLDDAITHAQKLSDEIFIIGGASIYEQAIKKADKLYLTLVHSTFDADTFFPDYKNNFVETKKEEKKDENFAYTFVELQRK